MGAYPSHTSPVTDESFDAACREFLEQHAVLRRYAVDRAYPTASGRLFRTYRIRHRTAPRETVAICKAAWLREDAWHHQHDDDGGGGDNTTTTTTTTATVAADDDDDDNHHHHHHDGSNPPQASSTSTSSHNKNNKNNNTPVQSLLADLEYMQRASRDVDALVPYTVWCDAHRQRTGRSSSSPSSRVLVALLRPHVYGTLRDRLAARPFWTTAEKTHAVVQLLRAVRALHDDAGLTHGHLSGDNVGVTSAGRLVILDGGVPALKKTVLPDDDPTEYLYYFQKTSYGKTTTASTEDTPCYLAPERFVSHHDAASHTTATVTPAMDIFSVGCLVVEICLGGAASCFDHLGQLLAYARGHGSGENDVQRRLGRLERSALRAAARHMLSRDPDERLSAAGYLARLEATGQVPETLVHLDALIADRPPSSSSKNRDAAVVTPDSRLVQCVQRYPEMIRAALGKTLPSTTWAKWKRWTQTTDGETTMTTTTQDDDSPRTEPLDFAEMLAETEAMLQALDQQVDTPPTATTSWSESKGTEATGMDPVSNDDDENDEEEDTGERSELCQSSLIIYLQIILSTLRHVQRPASKWAALQLVDDMCKSNYISDEARLQRVVPVAVSLLHDADALVRATALTVLTHTLTRVTVFSPSDAPIIPQYVAKRISHLPADTALLVRVAFAQCMPLLAEVAQRFLDVTHAVRIYEAVGGGGAAGTSSGYTTDEDAVFSEDVTQLLDTATVTSGSKEGGDKSLVGNKTLLGSTYTSERESLYETVSRWVVHMATDQSEDASLPKRAMLHHMGRLCTFFGQQGVMSLLLPQIVTFLNDRKDWQLRAALFQNLTPVCQKIGRAATEEFALPCLEIGFVDSEEQVIRCALNCLCRLVELGLLSRASILGTGESSMNVRTNSNSLLERYAIFLIHPSEGIRKAAISVFVRACQVVGSPDTFVYILPTLKPFLQYQPTVHHLQDSEKLQRCLQQPWSRVKFQTELDRFANRPSSGTWTAVGIQMRDSADDKAKASAPKEEDEDLIMQIASVKDYLRMLAMHNVQTSSVDSQQASRVKDKPTIEANLKLAQSVMFPRQDFRTARAFLPEWYENVQQKTIEENSSVTAQSTIRSISALGSVYGISIMGPEGTTENIIGAAAEDASRPDTNPAELLDTESTKVVEAASLGQWSAESVLDPDVIDASLLVSKLKALGVPQLPPKLGEHIVTQKPTPAKNPGRGSPKEPAPAEWRPRIKSLVATSSTISGHKAPVVRLAVSVDSSFFVSGSHDGTCGVWETSQLDDSVGVLESSLVYSGHTDNHSARINDVAMVEGTHSVVSGDSSGGVHVWRVDMVQSTSTHSGNRTARAVGSSEVRRICRGEGEVLAVTHFTGLSNSVILFASQKGSIHSWDLRCAQEPFLLRQSPSLGHLTTMALGNDRQWLVSGTNKGYLALWDVRFQNAVKLWRHKSGEKIHRAATSYVPPPQSWTGRFSNTEPRPFVFLGTGANECAMFDMISGSSTECFRTISTDSKLQDEGLPSLLDIPILSKSTSPVLAASGPQFQSPTLSSYPSINCMVGSVGGQNQSFLVTGGSDRRIRFWDFATPTRCYTVAGETSSATRSSYERIDFEGPRRLMLCRQPPALALRESGHIGNYPYHGMKKPENHHTDSVMDLKIIDNGLVSCSRDCTVKVWR